MEELEESLRRGGEKKSRVRKARLEKHHEGIWSERVKELVVLKNKMRKRGVPTKSIMKTIRAEKVKMRAQVRVERNEDLKEQRRRNPKRYWIEMNKLLGRKSEEYLGT